MEGIVAIIVQAIAGAAGGGIAGNLIKSVGMSIGPKLISGALGGVAGGSILGAIFSGGTVADPAAAAGGMDMASLIVQLVGAVVGGGALTGIAGQFLGKK